MGTARQIALWLGAFLLPVGTVWLLPGGEQGIFIWDILLALVWFMSLPRIKKLLTPNNAAWACAGVGLLALHIIASTQPWVTALWSLRIVIAWTVALTLEKKDVPVLRSALLWSLVIPVLAAVSQVLTQTVEPSVLYGIAEHLPETRGTSVVEMNGLRFLRAYGTLPHPNVLGGYGVLTATLAALAAAPAASIAATALIALSFSKNALIAWLVTTIVLLKTAPQTKRALAQSWAVLAVLVLCLAPVFLARTQPSRLEALSVTTRLTAAQTALQQVPRFMWTGTGLGNYKQATRAAEPAHFLPLHAAVELGIAGLLAWAALARGFLRGRLVAWVWALVPVVALAIFDHFPLTIAQFIYWAPLVSISMLGSKLSPYAVFEARG